MTKPFEFARKVESLQIGTLRIWMSASLRITSFCAPLVAVLDIHDHRTVIVPGAAKEAEKASEIHVAAQPDQTGRNIAMRCFAATAGDDNQLVKKVGLVQTPAPEFGRVRHDRHALVFPERGSFLALH